MSQYQIAVVVGSLRRDSFNRKLATAVVKLGPPEFSFRQVQIGDLPLYNQDDDASQADAVKRLKAEIIGSHGVLFVTAEYNRFDPWRAQECNRPRFAPVWPKRLGREAGRYPRRVGGRYWNGDSTAASAQCPRLPGHADAWHTRSIHPRKGRVVRRGRGHRTRQQGISPGLDGQVCRLGETACRLTRSRIAPVRL
jgi:hypothetical protein